MILSHAQRLIFLKTRKVAGTSFEIALSRFCGPGDIISPFGGKWGHPVVADDEEKRQGLGYRGPQNFAKPLWRHSPSELRRAIRERHRARQFYEHMPAREIRARIDEETWQGYRKVSIVRNPFDFAVSNYYWFRATGRTDLPFEAFLRQHPETLKINHAITHNDGAYVVDTMLRYESLAQDAERLGAALGLGTALRETLEPLRAKSQLRARDKTTAEHFAGFEEGIEIVRSCCAGDFERFGYAPMPV
jgi:nuclear transport factor 2 (NTF2) superfamily protein